MKNSLLITLFSLIFSFFSFTVSAATQTEEIKITPKIRAQYEAQALRIINSPEGKLQFRNCGVNDPKDIDPEQHLLISTSEVTVNRVVKTGDKSVNIFIWALWAKDNNKTDSVNSQSTSLDDYGVGLAMESPMIGSKASGMLSIPVKNELSGKEIITLVLILLIACTDLISWGWRNDLRNQKEILAAQQEEETDEKLENLRNGNGFAISSQKKLVLISASTILFLMLGSQTFAKGGGGKNFDYSLIGSDLKSDDWLVIAVVAVILALAVVFGICSLKSPKELEPLRDKENTDKEEIGKNIEPIEVQAITDTTENSGAELSSA